MRLVLSDTALPTGLPVREDWHYVDLSQLKIADCMGCFSCWVRTPGAVRDRDDAVGVYPLIAHSDHVIYVSRLFCGPMTYREDHAGAGHSHPAGVYSDIPRRDASIYSGRWRRKTR